MRRRERELGLDLRVGVGPEEVPDPQEVAPHPVGVPGVGQDAGDVEEGRIGPLLQDDLPQRYRHVGLGEADGRRRDDAADLRAPQERHDVGRGAVDVGGRQNATAREEEVLAVDRVAHRGGRSADLAPGQEPGRLAEVGVDHGVGGAHVEAEVVGARGVDEEAHAAAPPARVGGRVDEARVEVGAAEGRRPHARGVAAQPQRDLEEGLVPGGEGARDRRHRRERALDLVVGDGLADGGREDDAGAVDAALGHAEADDGGGAPVEEHARVDVDGVRAEAHLLRAAREHAVGHADGEGPADVLVGEEGALPLVEQQLVHADVELDDGGEVGRPPEVRHAQAPQSPRHAGGLGGRAVAHLEVLDEEGGLGVEAQVGGACGLAGVGALRRSGRVGGPEEAREVGGARRVLAHVKAPAPQAHPEEGGPAAVPELDVERDG